MNTHLIKHAIEDNVALAMYNDLLTSINWHKELRMVRTGIMSTIPRKMAYIADEPVMYRYDKFELPGDVWNQTLLDIKAQVERITGEKFNSVLLNLYENGKDEIGWHFDKEKQLGSEPLIVCLNLGAGRKFSFKSREDKLNTQEYWVKNGDVLIMDRQCQKNWLHAILKDPTVTEPRISLTFRWVYPVDESGITLVSVKETPSSEYDLYIGRENKFLGLEGSKWGNPFRMKNESERPKVLEQYEEHIRNSPELIAALPELKGLILGCYCWGQTSKKKCHGSVLIKLYNEFVLGKKDVIMDY